MRELVGAALGSVNNLLGSADFRCHSGRTHDLDHGLHLGVDVLGIHKHVFALLIINT